MILQIEFPDNLFLSKLEQQKKYLVIYKYLINLKLFLKLNQQELLEK